MYTVTDIIVCVMLTIILGYIIWISDSLVIDIIFWVLETIMLGYILYIVFLFFKEYMPDPSIDPTDSTDPTDSSDPVTLLVKWIIDNIV